MSTNISNVPSIKSKFVKYFPYFLVILIIVVIIIITIILSEYIQVKKTLNRMSNIYKENRFTKINYCNPNMRNYRVADFYIASSHNSCIVSLRKVGYVSLKILKKVLLSGARFIELNIYNKEQKNNTEPVISNGKALGDLKYTTNTIRLDDALKIVGDIAF